MSKESCIIYLSPFFRPCVTAASNSSLFSLESATDATVQFATEVSGTYVSYLLLGVFLTVNSKMLRWVLRKSRINSDFMQPLSPFSYRIRCDIGNSPVCHLGRLYYNEADAIRCESSSWGRLCSEFGQCSSCGISINRNVFLETTQGIIALGA